MKGLILSVVSVVIVVVILLILLNNNNNLTQTNSTYSVDTCWHRVFNLDSGEYYWPDGCKGNKSAEFCTQALVQLNESEIAQYLNWKKAGSPEISGCVPNRNIFENDLSESDSMKFFTMEEVSRGNTSENCYVAYKGQVFLIPENFQRAHPGGFMQISSNCGKDISSIFDASHSGNLANNQLMEFKVGTLR